MKKNIQRTILIAAMGFVLLGATIDLDNLFNYANQEIPDYINKDNTDANEIDDKTATLGRVLFYDKNLSSNGTISCASCHLQSHAFGDPAVQSSGVNGLTARHSMRLINARFSEEESFFWDERAPTLEDQITQPIRDPIEMGFSGTNGDPTFEDLIDHLNTLEYYPLLFEFAFGDDEITENRIQLAIAQFIRSIQSFDSRFDEGLAQVNFASDPFPNYTLQENRGKDLYLNIGCADCHILSEFALHINSLNNGVITVAGDPTAIDITNVRAPTLRDLVKPDGTLNGPFMHDGSFTTLLDVINHYNNIPNNPENTNLDTRLIDPNGEPQQLNLTEAEKQDLIAFLRTLGGNDVYTNEKWADPFEEDGSITIIGEVLNIDNEPFYPEPILYPNPATHAVFIEFKGRNYRVALYSQLGALLADKQANGSTQLNLENYTEGVYFVEITLEDGSQLDKRILKN